jgi:endonuclease YncB( thermonuclease family)
VLEAHAALDRIDRYGRILRYIRRAGVNVNVELVRCGAAAPYFYRDQRGRYARALLAAALAAKAEKARPVA